MNCLSVASSNRDTIDGLEFAEAVFGQCEGGAEFGEGHGLFFQIDCSVFGVRPTMNRRAILTKSRLGGTIPLERDLYV